MGSSKPEDRGAGCTSNRTHLKCLPDDLLHRILSLAYQNQIFILCRDSQNWDGATFEFGIPPCHGVSKRLAKVAATVPVRLLKVLSDGQNAWATAVLLRSLRCPIQVMDFCDRRSPRIARDWTPILEFVSCCPYPEVVQLVRLGHGAQTDLDSDLLCECKDGLRDKCSHLQDMITAVRHRMPQAKLLVSSHQI